MRELPALIGRRRSVADWRYENIKDLRLGAAAKWRGRTSGKDRRLRAGERGSRADADANLGQRMTGGEQSAAGQPFRRNAGDPLACRFCDQPAAAPLKDWR